MGLLTRDPAAAAYAALAEHYDLLTRHYRHDDWVRRLEALARAHGVRGRRALDVGCGNGRSLLPLLDLGYEATGCDLSPEMLAVARRAVPAGVELVEADMRALPALGEFDLVTCLDDAVNYLLAEEDLRAAARSFASVLAPGGVLVFDLNTRLTYETSYRSSWVAEDEDVFLCWHGAGWASQSPEIARATVEVFAREEDGCWTRASSVHVQRHWPLPTVAGALAAAGLRVGAVRGQRVGAVIERELDESRHTKAVVVAGREVRPDAHPGAVRLDLLARGLT
jgi:SAM-dependent methyltransferase